MRRSRDRQMVRQRDMDVQNNQETEKVLGAERQRDKLEERSSKLIFSDRQIDRDIVRWIDISMNRCRY